MAWLRWLLVFWLAGATICVSIVPRVDLPETTFNETDAPVNLASPVRPRVEVTRPAVAATVLRTLPFHRATRVVSSLLFDPAATPNRSHQHSSQDLLCTFLI
jgi:hypothetical protein